MTSSVTLWYNLSEIAIKLLGLPTLGFKWMKWKNHLIDGQIDLIFVLQMSTMPGLSTRPCFYDIDIDTETETIFGLF